MLIALTSGAYQSRSIISSAQACINLYVEPNPPETSPEAPTTHYPTPGNTLLSAPPIPGYGRGAYVDTNGTLWACVGANVYTIDASWAWTLRGSIAAAATPVSFSDNETTVILVDGSTTAYTAAVGGGALTALLEPDYTGSYRVDFLNTYFLFGQPNTPKFYTTLSNTTDIDPLYFANLTGQPTDIVAPVAIHGVVWLIGKTATEIWFDAGDTNVLPFQRMPDMVLHQGCSAPYSIARMSGTDDSQVSAYWLSQNKDGDTVILMSQGYTIQRVSTYAIENAINGYAVKNDAIGGCYQQDGHGFYVLSFPSQDVTWVYDRSTGQWHQRDWLDTNGVSHRYRNQAFAYPYNTNVSLDWENGNLYRLDLSNYTDNDQPIRRLRSFPHLVQGLNRVEYARFVADVECGSIVDVNADPVEISLRWSDDRGATYGNAVTRSIGRAGQYDKTPLWLRLGTARDRVFELSWSVPARVALNGAYVEPMPLMS